jgi:hypothetical protein
VLRSANGASYKFLHLDYWDRSSRFARSGSVVCRVVTLALRQVAERRRESGEIQPAHSTSGVVRYLPGPPGKLTARRVARWCSAASPPQTHRHAASPRAHLVVDRSWPALASSRNVFDRLDRRLAGLSQQDHLTREGTAALSASLGDRTDPVITEPGGPARVSMAARPRAVGGSRPERAREWECIV